jgi:hypothetical protein
MQASDVVSPPAPSPDARPPRASASLVVVRDAPDGIEVLLSRRAERGDHTSGACCHRPAAAASTTRRRTRASACPAGR